MKIRGYVKLMLVLSLVCNSVLADNTKTDEAVKQPKTQSSLNTMLDSMDDPIANKAFHEIQLSLLQTVPDSLLYNFFTESEIFSPLYKFLVKNNEKILAGFEMYAKSNMVQVTVGAKHKYGYIDQLVVDVASNLGFTKEAIQNRQIYILGGDENAFTVSGSQKKIIVVFQRGILERMSPAEIAGVLAHELGHIRAEHTVKGIMNSLMLEITGELFVNGKLSVSPQNSDFSKITHENCMGVCSHSKSILESQQTQQSLLFKNQEQNIINQKIQEFVLSVANMPKAQLAATVGNYLYTILQVAELENAPTETIAYFNTLLSNVLNIGTFKVNMQEYITHAQQISLAISRAKEKTADQISASTIRNEHLASAFSKMLGLDFDQEFKSEIFEQINKQAKEILTTVPASQLSNYVGTTHPALVLRINTILSIPTYPTVLFANNFLRLLLLNDALVATSENAKAALENFKKTSAVMNENFEKQMIELSAKGASADEIKKLREYNEKRFSEVKAKYEKYVADASTSQLKHEAKVLELLFSKEYSAGADRAPRMDNTIQYLSIQRENFFFTAELIKKQIAELKSANTEQSARTVESLSEALVKINKSLANQKNFMEKIKSRIVAQTKATEDAKVKENLKKRYILLSKILSAKNSLALESVRDQATIAPDKSGESVYRRNKIPVKLPFTAVTSPSYAGTVCSSLFR